MGERLSIEDLRIEAEDGSVLVDGLSLAIAEGEVHGLIGESGSGKSLTALATMGLLPPGVRAVSGAIRYGDQDVLALAERERRALRGAEIALVFQDPNTTLDPTKRVGQQVTEAARLRGRVDRGEARALATRLLTEVGIASPAERVDAYPHELSGGMRQRALIAAALAGEPKLLVADEPTTALDVTVQAQIIELIDATRRRNGLSVLLITHDLGVAARLCDRITVVYGGRVLESGPADEVFRSPRSPYTDLLLASVPLLARGWVPPAQAQGDWTAPARSGCRYSGRCALARPQCHDHEPDEHEHGPGHRARCFATEPGGWACSDLPR